MITVLLKNWKLGFFTVLILLVAFFAYQWKSAKAEIAEQAVVLNRKISTLEETLAHNQDQLKKAEEINEEYERNAEAQKVIEKANTEAKDRLSVKTGKVDRTKAELTQESYSQIPENRVLSAESVNIMIKLIETVDPLLPVESNSNVSQG
jgi:chromosome segregation ATPase